MTTQDEVAAILRGWAVTTCVQQGWFWTIGGLDPYGRAHSGSRVDPIALAHDLARCVEPPPILEIDRTPAAVQPTLQAEASAGVEDLSPSTPAAPHVEETPEPQHEGEPQVTEAAETQPSPAYPGMLVREDRENYLRGQITVRATRMEQNRLQGRFDVNAQERQRWGFTTYQNLSAQELPIPDDVQAAYDEFLQADGWIRATKAHADNLRAAAISVPLEMLEAMQDQIDEGWP
ncbi:MAG: hypothetical protein EBR82_76095 [Caulobacteraceae bacterium]|nr:hypothetical protein [Caulobacteraceae bacterium]